MALFTKKTWKDRLVEYAGRRKLVRVSGDPNGTMVVDVTRNEGNVSQAGDAFSEANMNDLEDRIQTAIGSGNIPVGLGSNIISAITALNAGIINRLGDSYIQYSIIKRESGSVTTMTELFVSLSQCICMLSTENITDKPTGKYGTILIFKYSSTRAAAICICTDGTMYVNAWNASTSSVTGWKEK